MQGSESSGSESPTSPRGGRRWPCPSPITGDESSDSEADEPSTNVVTQNVPSPHSDSPTHRAGIHVALRPKSPHCKHGWHRVLDQGGDRVALRLCFAHRHATTGAARAAKCPVRNDLAVLASGGGGYRDSYGSNKPESELRKLYDARRGEREEKKALVEKNYPETCEWGSHRQLHQRRDDLQAGVCFGHINTVVFEERNRSVRLEEMGRTGGSSWGIGRDGFASRRTREVDGGGDGRLIQGNLGVKYECEDCMV